ncbi:MAG: hypothetical protein ACYS0G_09730 [Planctomycetota bacterium]|jgi:hypothetical protein
MATGPEDDLVEAPEQRHGTNLYPVTFTERFGEHQRPRTGGSVRSRAKGRNITAMHGVGRTAGR